MAVLARPDVRDAPHRLHRVRDQVEVRERGALGQAGRSARVDQRGRIGPRVDRRDRRQRAGAVHRVLPPAHPVSRRDRRPGLALLLRLLAELDGRQLAQRERHVVGELRRDHLADARRVAHLAEVLVDVLQHDHHVDARVLDLMLELALRVERVVAHRDRPDPLAGVPRDHVLRTVRQQQPDTIALLHAEPGEHSGEPLHVIEELAVRHVGAEERRGMLVGEPRRGILEQAEERHLGERLERSGHVGGPPVEPRPLWGHGPHHSSTGRDPQPGQLRAARRMPGRSGGGTPCRPTSRHRRWRSAACSCVGCD